MNMSVCIALYVQDTPELRTPLYLFVPSCMHFNLENEDTSHSKCILHHWCLDKRCVPLYTLW